MYAHELQFPIIITTFQPSLDHRSHSSIKTAMQRQQPSTTVLSRNLSCCYIDDDDEDSGERDRSLDDMEAGFSRYHRRPSWSFANGYLFKGPFVVCSPRFIGRTRYYEDEVKESMRGEPHFLDYCFLCEKPLRNNNDDIFMYRGDTPFCSEDCRQEQIELDQQRERNMNLFSSMRALWNKEQQEGRSNSPSKSTDRRLRTCTVAVA